MNECICTNCQFEIFLKEKPQENRKLFYSKEENTDNEYCIFHASEKIKSSFSYHQNQLFKKSINDYINFCLDKKQRIDFSQSIFHIPFEIKGLKTDMNIDFTETVFIEYFRMDNLTCKEIIFKDTEFYDGGGIKNRGEREEVYIEKLIFRPYQLESDFVIDIGRYANSDGRIEIDKYGVLKNIKFENHKKGSGIVYFIGLNEQVEEADFRNMILDNVSFQNSDLSKCFFLNAKIDKSEFRNCEFPQQREPRDYHILQGKKDRIMPFLAAIFLVILGYFLTKGFEDNSLDKVEETFLVTLLILFMILISFFTIILPPILHLITYYLSKIPENEKHGIHTLNKFKFIHYHFCIADEKKIYDYINAEPINEKRKKKIKDSLYALESNYKQLKENFLKNDYQISGNFFYAQRFSEIISGGRKDQMIERYLLLFHHFANGFGERFFKPLILFISTLFIFAFAYEVNDDFIATESTPSFLLDNNRTIIKNQYYVTFGDENKTELSEHYRIYKPVKLKDDFKTRIMYSFSQFISPITNKNRIWFKTIDSVSVLLNYIETIMLLFFFGAFLLALKNRIKR